jgi:hypothetical protein
MGEYATTPDGTTIKMGTAERMFGLRITDVFDVTPDRHSLNPAHVAEHLVFRFPFPDEDGKITTGYGHHDRAQIAPGQAAPPEAITHRSVQFKSPDHRPGFLVNLPCPEGPQPENGPLIHRNGYVPGVRIVGQRIWNGHVALVAACGGCGAKYRYEELEDVEPLLASILDATANLRRQAKAYDAQGDADYAARWETIAARIREGYENPPAWVTERHP